MAQTNRRGWPIRRVVDIAGIVAALGLAAATAFAQDVSQADVAVGYVNIGGTMKGVNVQATFPLTEHWNLVGEFNRASGADCSGCDPEFRDTSILAGVRYSWHPTPRVSPFWQVLAGGLHSKADEYYEDYCCGLGRRLQPGYTIDHFALQPGGGVTVMVTPRFGMRTQADLQVAIPDQSKWEGISIFPRVVVGGVIRLGRTR